MLASIGGRTAWSVSDIEAYAGCPVKWLVDRRLRLGTLEPDDETLLRGAAAHAALERALRRLVRENGSTVLSPDRLPQAREAVEEALEGLAGRIRLSTDSRRVRALARRLEVDLLRYVEYAAHAGSSHVPTHFEVSFGGPKDDLGPLRLSADVAVAGRIDRIDVAPGGRDALVYDYKGRTTTDGSHWVDERKWQVALYLIAVRELLELQPAGGLYQPLGSRDLRPRGALLEDADPGLDVVGRDRRDAEGMEHARRRRRRAGARGRLRAARWSAPAAPGDLRLRRRLLVPHDLPERGVRSFTEEQAGAVARREGPLLLAAGAGSGKTSVLVERFVRSVLDDGLRPGQILAITFTEKAAGELRSRVRARFLALGEREAARETESAWIGTIHGFCTRVLRGHAVAAGLDPAFVVLDDTIARELRATAWRRAYATWIDDGGDAAVDVAAAYGVDRLEEAIGEVHDALRSAGATIPALPPIPPVAPVAEARAAVQRAIPAAQAELAAAKPGARVATAQEAVLAGRTFPTYKMDGAVRARLHRVPRRGRPARDCRARRAGRRRGCAARRAC